MNCTHVHVPLHPCVHKHQRPTECLVLPESQDGNQACPGLYRQLDKSLALGNELCGIVDSVSPVREAVLPREKKQIPATAHKAVPL